ncbi:MAG TPA: TIGR02281 family clan AA aspartic protease [Azospira sp.]|nr:TIGR02281 family clan AA aspartic protease [Azospira sp.]
MAAALAVPLGAQGVEVGIAGLFPNKALLVIDGAPAKAVAVGQKTETGVKLVAVDNGAAIVEVDGKRRTLRVGQSVISQSGGERASVVLSADAQGHFLTTGSVNGNVMRFLVDTGATMVSMGATDAKRLGIDLSKAEVGYSQTANGAARVYKVNLNTVRIGDVTLTNVDGMVMEKDMPVALLGMSFLNRMEMQRDGERMVLKKRY